MKRSSKNLLIVLLIIFIILVAAIVFLVIRDNPFASSANGTAAVSEAGSADASGQAAETENTAEGADAAVGEIAEEPSEEETTEPEKISIANEKPISLYICDNNTATKITGSYESEWTPYYPIATFEAINSEEETLPYNNYYALHEDYWVYVVTDVQYKIGYEISFDFEGERKVYTILSPSDVENSDYLFMGEMADGSGDALLGCWLYNDIGQSGFYTHLTSEEMTDSTLLTSIKIQPTERSEEISNLKLRAFSYSSDQEFDSDGRYIGDYAYELDLVNTAA